MTETGSITNWRHYARARVTCRVAYRDRANTWHTRTKDLSFGGLRMLGYQRFAIGTPLGLSLVHPAAEEALRVHGNVVQVYHGAEAAIGVAFDFRAVDRALVERWVRKVAFADPTGERALTRTPSALPLDAVLRHEPFAIPTRPLSETESAILQMLERGPITVTGLRRSLGDDWERRGQAIFSLIADGIIVPSAPPKLPPPFKKKE